MFTFARSLSSALLRRQWGSAGAFLALWLLTGLAQAHTIRPAVVSIVFDPSGRFEVQIKSNAEVHLAGIDAKYADTNDAPQAEEYDRLRALSPAALAGEFDGFGAEFGATLRLFADAEPVELVYTGIDVEDEPDLELARDSFIYYRGELPAGTGGVVWDWPEQYGSNVLRISETDSEAMSSVWLKRGQLSETYRPGGEQAERDSITVGLEYIGIGFEHILPKGLDHILFVLGIFLLSIHWRPLLWQVSAFTVAHTITLGLSIYGVISAPAGIVEPLIALSIAYVGIENCLYSRLQPWRPLLVFCFGLLHGMGFAGVLTEIGLPPSEFVLALITFNVGVELGQLAVIAGAFLLIGWWRNEDWYRQRVTIPLSLLISVVGLYWTWERIFA